MSEAAVTNEETTEAEAKMTQSQIDLARAVELIKEKVAAGTGEDDLMILLIQEGGFGYKKAGRMLNQALVQLNVRISAKDRYEQVCELLIENDFAPTTWDEVLGVVSYLAEEIDSTNEKQALVSVRKYAKENEIALPKKPKSESKGRGRGFRGQIFEWMIANVKATDDDFRAFMAEAGKPESMTKRYLFFRETSVKIHEAIVAARSNGS